jgi:hypothetical protein
MKTIGLAVLVAILPASAAARQDGELSVPVALREAQQLLVAAYPELREGRVTWRLDVAGSTLTVDARRVESMADLTRETLPLVGARVTTNDEGHLQELRATGTLIAQARQRVAPTPGRARSVDEVLKSAGAAYAPGDAEGLEQLVPAGLKVRLGAPTVRERLFRADASADAPEEALTWRVELEAEDPLGPRYTLVFEPVEGRLLSVVRR